MRAAAAGIEVDVSTVNSSQADGTALRLSKVRVSVGNGATVVEDVELELAPGEILGLVGESGSGKTTTALSVFGYTTAGAKIESVEVALGGREFNNARELKGIRGRLLAYVPQNPGTALNPALRIADAIADMIAQAHEPASDSRTPSSLLEAVGLSGDRDFRRRYPHQLSGGQQQRVCIAGALACEPSVVVLDEPTTGLDVVTQARVLVELARLRDEHGVSMVYVTHDLAVVSQIADRIAVMYAGRIVEQGPGQQVLSNPKHPYTRGLLASIPDHVQPRKLQPMPGVAVGVGDRPAGCAFAPRCAQRVERCGTEVPDLESIGDVHAVRCFEWTRTPSFEPVPLDLEASPEQQRAAPVLEVTRLRAEHRSRTDCVVAAEDVSFTLSKGSCVALVGESGSGKTTIARVIAGLHPIAGGEILLDGHQLPDLAKKRTVEQRRRLQIIFQNPADALNPYQTVRTIVARPVRILRNKSRADAAAEVDRLLELVRLPKRVTDCYPGELSGGERQRVAIARALAASPDVLICDEITSALDVSVQAAVLDVLNELRETLGLAILFISHDLGVIATIADHIVVLEGGLLCESGAPNVVLKKPEHPYTQRLLAAAPSLTVAAEAWATSSSTAAEQLIAAAAHGDSQRILGDAAAPGDE
jgi:peptide/nickel transport system ATP-binding protein